MAPIPSRNFANSYFGEQNHSINRLPDLNSDAGFILFCKSLSSKHLQPKISNVQKSVCANMTSFFLILATLSTLATAAPPSVTPLKLQPREVPPSSLCYCNERATNDYTIDIWIVNKTTPEYGMLSQGLRDNFSVFCEGYFVLWSDVEPIASNVATGESFPAEDSTQKLGAHINTGFLDLMITGYIVKIDLEDRPYDGCLSKVVERAENMNVTCPCST